MTRHRHHRTNDDAALRYVLAALNNDNFGELLWVDNNAHCTGCLYTVVVTLAREIADELRSQLAKVDDVTEEHARWWLGTRILAALDAA
jgi:hypothetical protein